MTNEEYAWKLNALDRLLNDPDVPMDPSRVWSLLADISRRDRAPLSMENIQAPVEASPVGDSE